MEWCEDLPRWGDSGKEVELLSEDGSVVRGTLELADVYFDGEDEVPVWNVLCPNADSVSLWNFEAWRLADQTE